MHFLSRNLAAIYIAFVTCLLAWLYGGTRGDLLVATVPWLMLFMFELIIAFPQRQSNEGGFDARERAWENMKKDPLVWTSILFIILLFIPFVNNGLCENCDAALIAEGHPAAPLIPRMPFCVNRQEHLTVFLWFVTALSAMIATKHCLLKSGKRLLIELIVWGGAALALFGFIQIATDAPGPFWQVMPAGYSNLFFATFGYVNKAGDYFTSIFCLSVAVWRWHSEECRKDRMADNKGTLQRDFLVRQNVYLIPAALCFFAAVNTLSRAAIILVGSLAIIFFIHSFITMTAHHSRAYRVKALAIWGGILIGVAIFFVNFTPKVFQNEMKTVNSFSLLDRVTGKNENHVKIATELWKDHVFFGCGGWGYRHLAYSKMDPKVVEGLKKASFTANGSANVHNDYVQFLAEHGLVGLSFLLVIVLLVVKPYYLSWKALVLAHRQDSFRAMLKISQSHIPRPIQIFVIPAPAFCIALGLIATLVHAFADCPLRSAAILTLFFVSLAAIDGFMPEVDLTILKQHLRRQRRRRSHHRHSESEKETETDNETEIDNDQLNHEEKLNAFR